MPKKSGIVFAILGAVLILSALLLLLYNGYEARRAGQEAELLLDDIRSAVMTPAPAEAAEVLPSDAPQGEVEAPDAPAETSAPEEEAVVFLDGYEYIGILELPDLEVELPVMAKWSYSRLKKAPCRHFGAAKTDDLVIAAHNYDTHFGRLHELKTGAEAIFTEMDGTEHRYALKELRTVAPDDVDTVQNSGCALVLYTCTPGGADRVAAFFDRAEQAGDDFA